MIGAPFPDGAVKLTEADAAPELATTSVGASGAPAGTTAVVGSDDGPVPSELLTVAVKT